MKGKADGTFPIFPDWPMWEFLHLFYVEASMYRHSRPDSDAQIAVVHQAGTIQTKKVMH